MKQASWEYLTAAADSLSDQYLGELGSDGWELVLIHESRAIFKRPGPDYQERITIAQREQLGAGRHHEQRKPTSSQP